MPDKLFAKARVENNASRAPRGLAEAFLDGEDFLDGDRCALVLGDGIFYGDGLRELLSAAKNSSAGAEVFSYKVTDPS